MLEEITPTQARAAKNPYSIEVTLEKLKHYLMSLGHIGALELLEKAITKAKEDESFNRKLEDTFLRGSTLEYRDLFSEFGDYLEKRRKDFPFYPHRDAVDWIDTAMHHIRIGYDQQYIDEHKAQQSRAVSRN